MSCGRCHRALKDAASIQRGYGPTCWAKMQHGDTGAAKKGESTVINMEEAGQSRVELRRRLLQAAQIRQERGLNRGDCQGSYMGKECKEPFGVMRMYMEDHDNGIKLKGYGKPQWAYLRCRKCGYETSYEKIINNTGIRVDDLG